MKKMNVLLAVPAILAAGFVNPGVARADFVLDTGTPAGAGAIVLNSGDLVAGEFAATAGDMITTVSAYLSPGSDTGSVSFTFDIYSGVGNGSFLGNRTPTLEAQATGTFTGTGWTTSTINWTPTVSGDYWIALVVPSSRAQPGLDAPLETGSGTGTVPALAFASAASASAAFTKSTTDLIGLQVTEANAVPLPPAAWLLGGGLFGLTLVSRRRQARTA